LELIDAITHRRSIRRFTSDPVPLETLTGLLRAAMWAPSACNAQPWHFVVVTDRATLDAVPEYHPYAQMSREAAAGVLVCADTTLETAPGNWMLDCSAATQNLLLAAHAAGLGAVWTGIWPSDAMVKTFRSEFGLPESVIPLCWVPIGVPAEEPEVEDRFRPERVHVGSWESGAGS
jgi:nitroreductase